MRTGLTETEYPILFHWLNFPNPDIAIAHQVVMVLEHQRASAAHIGPVMRENAVSGRAPDLRVVLYQHAVLKDGDVSWQMDFATPPDGRRESNVIGLPLSGWSAGVHERRMLAVNGAGLAVSISDVVVAVQHLYLVLALQEDAAVAAPLAVALRGRGFSPLDVKLDGAELLPCLDIARARNYLDVAVFNFPSGGPALQGLPL